MFILRKIGCRICQVAFRIASPFLPYREPYVISSYGELSKVFKKEKTSCVLIVTRRLPLAVEDELRKSQVNYVIYDKTQPNPTVDNVEEALELYYKNNCDALIAIGGGSPIDCAKAVGARVAYPKKPLEKLGGPLKVLRKIPTLVAVPTTAGTGSEVTLASVVSNPAEHKKYALMSFPLIPNYAILDATLTYSLPPYLTATTGMDALTHAVEAYIGRATTKKTRELSLEAVKMIFENLERAYLNGQDKEARENMLNASYKAGIAFSISYVGYIHAIAHSLGGRYGTPHGLANAIIMPYVLEEYGKSAHKKLHKLGIAVGVSDENDVPEVGAKKFIQAIRDLNERMNIPNTFTEIKKEDIPEMARHAEREANPLYPVPLLMGVKELEKIYYRISEE
ncbi:MAG: iron-containing alcohol dehydrogenase [Ruminococcaceae bacterium]|nr:iron-containing alcohol dehydrogenase [Oscillospiraceae bacterium]